MLIQRGAGPSHRLYQEVRTTYGGDIDSDGTEPVGNQSAVKLNSVWEIFGEDVIWFDQVLSRCYNFLDTM